MKKIFALLLVFVMLCLTGCGNNTETASPTDQSPTSSKITTPSEASSSSTTKTSSEKTASQVTTNNETSVLPTSSTEQNSNGVSEKVSVTETSSGKNETSSEKVTTSSEIVTTSSGKNETSSKKAETSHKHSYSGKITKAATCKNTGTKLFTCSCGNSYTETISKTNHSWGNWKTTKEPTIDKEGISQRVCNICKATETKPIATLPNNDPNAIIITKEQLKKIEEGFLKLVNEERKRVGLSSLKPNSVLEEFAQIRSIEIKDLFSHTRPNGEPWHSIVDYNRYHYCCIGENLCKTSHIGSGYYTKNDKWVGSDEQIKAAYTQIFTCFKNSPPHYSAMINSNYEECGIGISYIDSNHVLPMFYVAHIFGQQ